MSQILDIVSTQHPDIRFEIFGISITGYAISMVISVTIGICVLLLEYHNLGLKIDAASTVILITVPLGLVGAHIFYWLARYDDLFGQIGFDQIFYLHNGGYALWGAIFGVALANWIAHKVTKQDFSSMTSAIAVASSITVACARFSEIFSDKQGIGALLEDSAFCFYPVAVFISDYEEWHLAVFFMEAITALTIAFFMAQPRRVKIAPELRKHNVRPIMPERTGWIAAKYLILHSSTQMLFESLRQDDYLRWLFVRVQQLMSAVVLGIILLYSVVVIISSRKAKLCDFMNYVGAFVAAIGMIIAMEFAIDKWADLPNALAYCMIGFSCLIAGYSTYVLAKFAMAKEKHVTYIV